MSATEKKPRRHSRRKAVLPVRLRGCDAFGQAYEELAHTLDITPSGARIAGFRRQLNLLDQLTLTYRQRKMEFRVVWIKKLEGLAEYQVGLQAITLDYEAWGLNFSDFAPAPAVSPQVGAAQ